ncbi:hypothetical protein [Desulfurispora thermophila]|uniref:hypothetical protein n=1 Tax=Desulfurispora thermophila TaxID=265470 RepID=UPI00037D40E4|nr:hypothetical protein [Desulfurispora thermophila]
MFDEDLDFIFDTFSTALDLADRMTGIANNFNGVSVNVSVSHDSVSTLVMVAWVLLSSVILKNIPFWARAVSIMVGAWVGGQMLPFRMGGKDGGWM